MLILVSTHGMESKQAWIGMQCLFTGIGEGGAEVTRDRSPFSTLDVVRCNSTDRSDTPGVGHEPDKLNTPEAEHEPEDELDTPKTEHDIEDKSDTPEVEHEPEDESNPEDVEVDGKGDALGSDSRWVTIN